MRTQFLVIVIFSLITSGCYQRIKKSTLELDCRIYVERYDVNAFGVDENYLSDSSNFRIFVGKFDVEHETFSYKCKNDNIVIYKRAEDSQGKWKIEDSVILSKEYLIKNKVHSTKALFEFK